MGCNQKTNGILADIYGTQSGIFLQSGLADADDAVDFDTKLESLKRVWEFKIPGFHPWFVKNKPNYFKTNLIMEARQYLRIDGRLYTNGLELKHKLQKKHLKEADVPKEVQSVTKELESKAL